MRRFCFSLLLALPLAAHADSRDLDRVLRQTPSWTGFEICYGGGCAGVASAIIEEAETLSDYPLFTKPANLGSSVGVTKCSNRSDLQEGLMEAASYDRRVLVQLVI